MQGGQHRRAAENSSEAADDLQGSPKYWRSHSCNRRGLCLLPTSCSLKQHHADLVFFYLSNSNHGRTDQKSNTQRSVTCESHSCSAHSWAGWAYFSLAEVTCWNHGERRRASKLPHEFTQVLHIFWKTGIQKITYIRSSIELITYELCRTW